MLAYYPFDGNALDESGNNYNGIEVETNYVEDSGGNLNSALSLNGLNGYVNLSSFANAFIQNLNEITIYFKIKFESENNNQTILSLGNAGESLSTNVFEFELENNQIQLETEYGTSAINYELKLDNKDSLLTNSWHEIMVTIKDEHLVYCRNGEIIYDGLYIPTESESNNLFIGCFGCTNINSCCNYKGYIDELQFYNRRIEKSELLVDLNQVVVEEELEIYPNPSNGLVNIQLREDSEIDLIDLIDANGRELSKIRITNQEKHISIQMPNADGIYYLKLYANNNVIRVFKVIKK